MQIIRYKSSREGLKATIIFFIFLIVVIAIVAPGPETKFVDLIQGIGGLVAMFAVLAYMLRSSYIDIDEEKRTIMYCNWPIKSKKIPIEKIIQIGFPKQNYIIRSIGSFVYIWYDDPNNPGKDKYVKIKDTQFDKEILAQVGKKLKIINPNIKFGSEFQALFGK